MRKTTLGVIIGNRGFFPAVLARDGREEILRLLKQDGYETICLTPEETKFGAVETLKEARQCADLFKKHRDEIDGILVSLPNFGDSAGWQIAFDFPAWKSRCSSRRSLTSPQKC